MIKKIESITLFSQDARKLAKFYKEKIGLKIIFEAEMGEKGEKAFELKVGKEKGSAFYIIDHSKVRGKNKQPERVIINFEVGDIKKEARLLTRKKVKKTQDIYHVENYGFIATFQDIDGNYFQLVKVKPS